MKAHSLKVTIEIHGQTLLPCIQILSMPTHSLPSMIVLSSLTAYPWTRHSIPLLFSRTWMISLTAQPWTQRSIRLPSRRISKIKLSSLTAVPSRQTSIPLICYLIRMIKSFHWCTMGQTLESTTNVPASSLAFGDESDFASERTMNAQGTECGESLAQTKMGWFRVLHHSSFCLSFLCTKFSLYIVFSNSLNLALDTFIPVAVSIGPDWQTS